jgi:tetratricopeptide (TPR) repeat protein
MARMGGLLLLVAATVYSLARFVYLPLRCARAASMVATTPRAAARLRDDLRGCECVTAREAHVPFILGDALATLGDDRGAIAEYERALTIERRPEIYFALGMAQLRALQRAAALDNLTRACAFDPARLADIPYQDARDEVERRIRSAYGDDWVR